MAQIGGSEIWPFIEQNTTLETCQLQEHASWAAGNIPYNNGERDP
jgi:hypothetical protein